VTTSSSTANDTAAAGETQAALGRHLQSFAQGIETILANYTEASVIVTPDATYRGLDEIRGFFRRFLDSATPEFWDAFTLGAQNVVGDVAYITWSAKPFIPLATDTLIVRSGKIYVQTFTALQG
jgi:hypothetical protein